MVQSQNMGIMNCEEKLEIIKEGSARSVERAARKFQATIDD